MRCILSLSVVLAALLGAGCADHDAGHDHDAGAAPASSPAGGAAAVTTERVVETGCAMCMFEREGEPGCRTAIRTDGAVYIVTGSNVPDAEDHATGLCDRIRQARVSGTIVGDEFVAASFVLLPNP
jgi:hypothetical protein